RWRRDGAAVDLEKIVAFGNLNTGRAQGCLEFGIPVLTGVDFANSIETVFNREVRAQQPDWNRVLTGHISGTGQVRMTDGKLPSDGGDQIREVGAMLNIRQKRFVLFIDRLPIISVHLRVVEIVALDAPRLAEDLRPLGSRIDQRFELGNVDRSIANLGRYRAIEWNDSPSVPRACGLIQHLLPILGKSVRADAFKKRRRGAFLELIFVQPQARNSRDRFGIKNY